MRQLRQRSVRLPIVEALRAQSTESQRQHLPRTRREEHQHNGRHEDSIPKNAIHSYWKQFSNCTRAIGRVMKETQPAAPHYRPCASLLPDATESDPSVFVGDRPLLDSLGLGKLDEIVKSITETKASADTDHQVRSLVTQACYAGLKARVAPWVIVQRLRSALSEKHSSGDAWLAFADEASIGNLLDGACNRLEQLDSRIQRSRALGVESFRAPPTSGEAERQFSLQGFAAYSVEKADEVYLEARQLLYALAAGAPPLRAQHLLHLCASCGGEGDVAQTVVGSLMDWVERSGREDEAVTDFARSHLLECCVFAMKANTDSFEFNYALLLRYMTTRRALDSDGDDPQMSIQDALTHYSGEVMELLGPLCDSVTTGAHHLRTVRTVLLDLLVKTDVGYESSTVPATAAAYHSVLGALARIPLDSTTRYELLESTCHDVMLNSRQDVVEGADAHARILCVLSRCKMCDRALVVFNGLMAPKTKETALRDACMGAILLASRSSDVNVARFFSMTSQKHAVRIHVVHALAASLLLDATSAAKVREHSCSIYAVLDRGVELLPKRHNPAAEDTFALRLLTVLVQLDRVEDPIPVAHVLQTLRWWIAEFRQEGTSTVSYPTVGLLNAIHACILGLGGADASELAEAVATWASDLSAGLLSRPPSGPATLCSLLDPKEETVLFVLPSDFSALDAVMQWRVADIHSFVNQALTCIAAKGGLLTLEDYCTLADLHQYICGRLPCGTAKPLDLSTCRVLHGACTATPTVHIRLEDALSVVLPRSIQPPGASTAQLWLQRLSNSRQVRLSTVAKSDYFGMALRTLLVDAHALSEDYPEASEKKYFPFCSRDIR